MSEPTTFEEWHDAMNAERLSNGVAAMTHEQELAAAGGWLAGHRAGVASQRARLDEELHRIGQAWDKSDAAFRAQLADARAEKAQLKRWADVAVDDLKDRIAKLSAVVEKQREALEAIVAELTDKRDPNFGADDPAVIIALSALEEKPADE